MQRRDFVKRLIGLPGDVWEERNGVTYINGRRLTSRTSSADTPRPDRRAPRHSTAAHLHPDPEGQLPDEGRQPGHSCDSRGWGLVPRGNIIGKVVFTYWPLNRLGTP